MSSLKHDNSQSALDEQSEAMDSNREGLDPVRSLGLLLHYLTLLLANCAASAAETAFVWDWEMVREAMNPYKSSNVFSGVLWHGLETLQGLNDSSITGKIVYPEGTRREILWHLSGMVSAYRKRLRLAESREIPFRETTGLERYNSRREWHEVLADVGKLMRLDESVNRLLLLLTRYAEPMPLNPSEIPAYRVRQYTRELSKIRKSRDSRLRNEADAWNVASAELLSDVQGSIKRPVQLITATRAVRHIAKQFTKDPFYFALELQMRKDFPDKHARETVLHQMLARLHEIAARLGILRSLTGRDKPYMGRDEVGRIFQGFKELSLIDDPLLREVQSLVVRAAQALEDSRFQSQQVLDELDYTPGLNIGLGNFEQKIYAALERLGMPAPSASEMSLRWEEQWSDCELSRQVLVNSIGGRQLIEAELSPESVALCWPSGVSMRGFIEAVGNIWAAHFSARPLHLFIRTSTSQNIELLPTRPSQIQEQIRKNVTSRISLLRIVIDQTSFWYDAKNQLARRGQSMHLGNAQIALSFSSFNKDVDVFLKLYDQTSSHWLFSSALKDAFGNLGCK